MTRKFRITDFIDQCNRGQQKLQPMLSLADAQGDTEESAEITEDLKDISRSLTWLDTIKDKDRPKRD
jgi:hypothetical protein